MSLISHLAAAAAGLFMFKGMPPPVGSFREAGFPRSRPPSGAIAISRMARKRRNPTASQGRLPAQGALT